MYMGEEMMIYSEWLPLSVSERTIQTQKLASFVRPDLEVTD